MCSSSFCVSLLQKPGVEGPMQWFSSTAAQVAQLEEPRSGEQEVVSSNHQLRSLRKLVR